MVPRWFFMVPGRFLWFFMVPGRFSWFQVIFHSFFHGSRLVLMVCHGFRLNFYGSRSVFMVFLGSRMVFHGSRLVFHGFFPKNTRLNCILARRSSLGPPPGGRHRT